jgi:hypothetical protein
MRIATTVTILALIPVLAACTPSPPPSPTLVLGESDLDASVYSERADALIPEGEPEVPQGETFDILKYRSSHVFIRSSASFSAVGLPSWEKKRLGCADPDDEAENRFCKNNRAHTVKYVASDSGGQCGHSIVLITCYD